MTKSNDREKTLPSSSPADKLTRSILVLILIFLFSMILVHIHVYVPLPSFGVYPNPLKHVEKSEEYTMPELEEIKKAIDPKTEEIIRESFTLFKDLLTRFSESLDHNQSKSGVRNLEPRSLQTEIKSLFNTSSIVDSISDFLISSAGDASKFLAVGLVNGTITGLDLPRMKLMKNTNTNQKASTIGNIAENLGLGLSSSVVGQINIPKVMPSPESLSPTSKAIGEGAGSGAAAGLKLKPLDTNAFNNSGIPGMAGNLAQGLTSSFIGGVDLKATLMSAMGNMSSAQANGAALSLAQGLGSGAAFAANLSTSPLDDAFNKEGISGVAGSLGQGLTTSFIRGIDVQKIMAMAQSNLTPEQTNQAALALAQGLGSGAAFATKLSTTPPAFDKNGISGITGSVGQGLSTSFLQDINFKEIASNMAPKLTSDQILDASLGLGSGLIDGAAIGIGFQMMTPDSEMNKQGVGPAVKTFAKSLSQSFLGNGTVFKIIDLLKQTQSPPNIDFLSVAKGFAIGFVGGAEMSFENAGGLATVFDISPEDAAQLKILPMIMTNMNDTVGGAATGFGSGLGLETTRFVLQILGKPVLNSNNSVMPSPESQTNNLPALEAAAAATPDADAPTKAMLAKTAIVTHANNRQIAYPFPTSAKSLAVTSPDRLDLSKINETVNPLIKTAVDRLGCQGIGGLVAIALSLGPDISQVDPNQIAELQKEFMSKLRFADQIFTIQDLKTGNRVDINVAKFEVSLNRNSLKKEIIVLVLHIFLGIFIFAIAIPIVLIINSTRNFALLSGRTEVLKNASKIQWAISLAIILPSSLAIIVSGLLADGSRNHFYSSHGIIGTILILLTLLTFPLAYLRLKSNSARLPFSINLTLVLSLTVIVLVSGFADLSAISFCATQFLPQFIFVLLGILLISPLLQSVAMISLELLLKRWNVNISSNVQNSEYYLDSKKDSLSKETSPIVGAGSIKDSFMEI